MASPDLPGPMLSTIATVSKRHVRFYFPDGNVVFLVEDTLYRVYRGPFERNSSVFSTMFSLPQGSHPSPEGMTDDHPIRLEGVSCRDFDALLAVVSPAEIVHEDARSVEDWKAVVSLASKWEFESAKGMAIRHLGDTLSDVDKIVYGRRYAITPWIQPALQALCARHAPLSAAEIGKMLTEDVAGVVAVREQAVSFYRDDTVAGRPATHDPWMNFQPQPRRHQLESISALVASVFHLPTPEKAGPRKTMTLV